MYLKSFMAKTGITFLILLTLLSNISNSFRMSEALPAFLRPDNVSINESRLAGLKSYIKNVKEVGYITELDNRKGVFAIETSKKSLDKAIDITAQLILTQYTLCPTFVYNQTDLPLVVGNFPDGLPKNDFFLKKHLIPIKTFPNGLILLRREAK